MVRIAASRSPGDDHKRSCEGDAQKLVNSQKLVADNLAILDKHYMKSQEVDVRATLSNTDKATRG